MVQGELNYGLFPDLPGGGRTGVVMCIAGPCGSEWPGLNGIACVSLFNSEQCLATTSVGMLGLVARCAVDCARLT